MRFRLAFAFVLLVGLGACGGASSTKQPSGQSGGPGPPPATIKIGASLPLTGEESRGGELYKLGYELAVKQRNDGGGIPLSKFGGAKVKVELSIDDDRTDQKSVVSLSEKITSKDNADAMLSTYSTSLVSAQAPVAERFGVPYVNGGGASTPIFLPPNGQPNKWVFGTIANVTSMPRITAEWIASQQDGGKLPKPLTVAMLLENTAHGSDYGKGLNDFAKENPGRLDVKLQEKFELNTPDFTGLLQRVQAVNAQAFLVDAHLPDFLNMHKTYTTMGLRHLVVTYGARGSEDSAKKTLGGAADYILSATWWSPDLPTNASKRFVSDFKAAYGKDPEWYSALAYDSANVLLKAFENAGTNDKEAVRQALVNMNYAGQVLPGDSITFPPDAGYQTKLPFVVTQNLPGGKTEIVWPKKFSTAEGQIAG